MIPLKTVKRTMKDHFGDMQITSDATKTLQEGIVSFVELVCTDALQVHKEDNVLREIQSLKNRRRLRAEEVRRALERYLVADADADAAEDLRGEDEEAEK
jgi:hypothetical protein